jgi:hypothetical protein
MFYDDHESECCPVCGKEYEDFSDLGCPACDQRHPNFGQQIQVFPVALVGGMADAPYLSPLGLPLYWKDEQSGVLPAAIWAFINHKVDGAEAPTADQIKLIRDYFTHYINAPCWSANCEDNEMSGILTEARGMVGKIETAIDIDRFISKCMEIGLDPL